MIERPNYLEKIEWLFRVGRVVALLGPRQCGKTTLSKDFIKNKYPDLPLSNYFDLENTQDIERLSNASLTLKRLKGLIVIDEIQRMPEIFPVLRYIHDEFPETKFLILGNASRELIQQSSESLAGRINYLEVSPFNIKETHDVTSLWSKGGFPNSFLKSDALSWEWRKGYIRTFLETDLPGLGFNIPNLYVERIWRIIASYSGQVLNSSNLANSLEISHVTAKRYVDILASTFMVRVLQPWYENIGKRQIKRPKIYIRDTGILHYLLGIHNFDELEINRHLGSSWESFALEQILQSHHELDREAYFWQTHQKAELDLLLVRGDEKVGVEFKYSDKPRITKSMKIAMEDLNLKELVIVYPGEKSYELTDKVKILTLKDAVLEI